MMEALLRLVRDHSRALIHSSSCCQHRPIRCLDMSHAMLTCVYPAGMLNGSTRNGDGYTSS